MSEEADDSQKTEEPTARKLEEARKKGQIPRSREMNHWFMILGGLIAITAIAPMMLADLGRSLSVFLEKAHVLHSDGSGLGQVLLDLMFDVAIAMALPLLLFLVVAIAPSALQGGINFSLESMKPKPDKISPLAGFKRLFGMQNFVEFLKGVAKVSIVGAIAALLLYPTLTTVEHFVGMEAGLFLDETWQLAIQLVGGVLLVLTLLTAFDYAYQRFTFMKQMRMTKQEVKDEYKQTEGDPMVKSRLRQIRLERARRRMMAEVPKADVVITNPTHFAVALKYEQGAMEAPRLIAKGVDKVAFRIREVAEEHRIPIVENPPLARALHASVDIDEEIPSEHYKAVAEVISYVYKLRKNKGR